MTHLTASRKPLFPLGNLNHPSPGFWKVACDDFDVLLSLFINVLV